MLTQNQIDANFDKFIFILEPVVKARGGNWEKLLAKLVNSDFKRAPASTKYHNNFEGGLVAHCLNVYDNLTHLVLYKHLEDIISMESIVICGLLHDISKINLYEKTVKNKKVYSETGSKFDDLGRYDWVSEYAWTKKPESELFIYGNHEETSEFMIRQYLPLKVEESVAILSHHGGIGFDSHNQASTMFGRYELAALLHLADMMAAYIDEK